MNHESEPETKALLDRAVDGDQVATSELWSRYYRKLKRMVNLRMDRRVQGRVDPSDVLQEVFIDFAARVEQYAADPPMPLFLWLRFLTGQRLLLVHRFHLGTKMRDAGRDVSIHAAAAPQASSLGLAAQLLGRFTSVVHSAQRAEMRAALQETIDELDPLDREVLAMRHFEELSNGETAQALNIEASAASNRHVRALKRLRKALSGRPGFFETP